MCCADRGERLPIDKPVVLSEFPFLGLTLWLWRTVLEGVAAPHIVNHRRRRVIRRHMVTRLRHSIKFVGLLVVK